MRYAVRHLQQAIAQLHPMERQCIIGRLARKMTFDAIAGELEVAREDVLDILRRARDQVQVYTNYFNGDWYWPEPEAGAAV